MWPNLLPRRRNLGWTRLWRRSRWPRPIRQPSCLRPPPPGRSSRSHCRRRSPPTASPRPHSTWPRRALHFRHRHPRRRCGRELQRQGRGSLPSGRRQPRRTAGSTSAKLAGSASGHHFRFRHPSNVPMPTERANLQRGNQMSSIGCATDPNRSERGRRRPPAHPTRLPRRCQAVPRRLTRSCASSAEKPPDRRRATTPQARRPSLTRRRSRTRQRSRTRHRRGATPRWPSGCPPENLVCGSPPPAPPGWRRFSHCGSQRPAGPTGPDPARPAASWPSRPSGRPRQLSRHWSRSSEVRTGCATGRRRPAERTPRASLIRLQPPDPTFPSHLLRPARLPIHPSNSRHNGSTPICGRPYNVRPPLRFTGPSPNFFPWRGRARSSRASMSQRFSGRGRRLRRVRSLAAMQRRRPVAHPAPVAHLAAMPDLRAEVEQRLRRPCQVSPRRSSTSSPESSTTESATTSDRSC